MVRKEEILEELKKYKHVIDFSDDSIVLLDRLGRFTFINRKTSKLTGYKKKELIGSHFKKVIPSKHLPKCFYEFQRQLRGLKPRIFEVEIKTKRGKLVPVEINGLRVKSGGKTIGVQVITRDITERKKAEEEIKVSEEKFKTIFDSSTDMICIQDIKTGEVIDVNQTTLDACGCTKEEFIKKGIAGFTPKSPKYNPKKIIQKVIRAAAGNKESFEWAMIDKYNKIRNTEVKLKLIKLGGKDRLLAVVRDITERKKTEGGLRKSEKRASAAIEAARGFTFNYDIATGKIEWGGSIKEITGYTPEEFKKIDINDWAKRIHPDDRKRILSILKKAVNQKRATATYRWKTKKGYVTFSSISLTEKENGKAVRLVGFLQDITKQKKAEEKLISTHEMLSESQKMARAGSWEFYPTVKKVIWSEGLFYLLGYKPGTVKETPDLFTKHIHPDDRKRVWNTFNKAARQKKDHFRSEYRIIKCNKSVIHVETFGENNYDKKGNITTNIGYVRDVTEQKRAEELIKKEAVARLEIKKLKELDILEKNFVNMVTHELKTPLTASFLHIGILENLKEKLPESEKNSLETLKRNCKRLNHLINNLLEVTRIQSKRFRLRIRKTNLKECIEEVAKEYKVISKKKGIKLIVKIDKIPTIRADEERVKTILNNLIGNAVKFTRKGSVTIKAKKQDKYVLVNVKDTGVGISKKDVPKLFELFWKAKGDFKKYYNGVGLGLPISKNLIELHGGEMNVKSVSGKGSTFSFKLPIKKR